MNGQEQSERKEVLFSKALTLPLSPGVYIMKNRDGKIIYVGKSRALRSRVSQYFSSERYSSHNFKTKRMVDSVYDFEFILTDTEIEALALENNLIKLHMPRYNIRLKDGKSYPYIRIGRVSGYPRLSVTRTRRSDGADYFGPYSGMGVAYDIYNTVCRIFGVPNCKYVFPRDMKKVRPCLYMHIGQCVAPCNGECSIEQLNMIFKDVAQFLRGNIRKIKNDMTQRMMKASDDMMFELAAIWRDRINAVNKLLDKQKVVGDPDSNYDAISVYRALSGHCIAIGSVREGALSDCSYTVPGADVIFDSETLITIICDHYDMCEDIPQDIETDFGFSDEEMSFLSEYLSGISGKKVYTHIAQRGDKKQLCNIINENAARNYADVSKREERKNETLLLLSKLASLEVVPDVIESIDISNYSNECITAGIVRFTDGKKDKSGYRTFNIRSSQQDDYSAMSEAISRRLDHTDELPLPDLLLLDGGRGHVSVIKKLLSDKGVYIPVLGMVKDSHHKTRILTDGENDISIAGYDSLFRLIYEIQEEVHRFTYSRMKSRKKKKTISTSLTAIEGIGEKKAAVLISEFRSVKNISLLSVEQLSEVKGISEKDAKNIYNYFLEQKSKKKGEGE